MQGFSLTKLWKNVLEDTMKATVNITWVGGFSGIWHLIKNTFLLISWNRSNSWKIRANFINVTGWHHQYRLMFSKDPDVSGTLQQNLQLYTDAVH